MPCSKLSSAKGFYLLIVDEAHNVAPAGRGHYAVDSLRTQAIRAIAPHFEHKLFPFLRRAYGPMSKADVLAETKIAEAAWKAAIDQLKAEGVVEQIGERRGAKYRLARR